LDGDLDLFVTNGRGGYPFNNGPDQLFRNIGNGNNWLQIDLEGTVSNRDGIGARLFAATPDGKIQLRENGGGIHWCQQDQKRIHFGLAQNEKVSELTVYWPSGIIQKLTSVPVNQVLHVVEPHGPPDLAGDVNQDRQVDIIDFVIVVKHFGEKAPTEPRADVNKDGEVNILDLLWIIKAVDGKLTVATAPSHNPRAEKASETNVWSLHYQLSEGDIDRLYAFYGNIEEISDDVTQIKLVRHFLRRLLRLFEGPLETKLYPNYPNPFNPETWIPYQLAEDTEVKIRVYDVSGHLVRTVFSGHQAVGYYLSRNQAAYWDGRNEVGERVAGGVYIYELKTDTFQQTGRFVLIK